MKKILAICIFLLCCGALYSAGFVFADKGKAVYTIVLPDKTAGFEKQAAEDLQTFFGKMSGASFEIVPESRYSGQKGIFIGNTAFARKNGVEVKKLSAETWVIKSAGTNLILLCFECIVVICKQMAERENLTVFCGIVGF